MSNNTTRDTGKQLISGLYAIADGAWNPCVSLAELARKFLDGGCRIIQLRMKDASKSAIFDAAKEIAALKKTRDFTFIINDHADIAIEAGADGVHVGENDTPVDELRRKYGKDLIVGYSSHSIDEAKRAASDGADYVAFGAIFPTRTKGPGHPVQGLSRLKELVSVIDAPVVAIGGIDRNNVRDVIGAGARSAAMITALAGAEDVVSETRWFVEAIRGSKI